ncbi:BTAD domain-containing putative transcriptional regulator [Streptomyces sp. NPDC014894]|uniref:BTAD domain-containing putative transcriptional regulator n=1 Tax=Streptomyces sp. NPDC014894 TaxID=3364931 RepID=UPI0037000A45
MDVGFLGPLEVRGGGQPVTVGGARLRTLLIRLALEAGKSVSVGSLAAALWPREAPVNRGHAVQALVSRLRRALPDDTPLRSANGGYCLDIPPDAVDALRFETLARRGGRALREGRPQDASRLLGEALTLWRGEPLADMSESAFVTGAVARLEELRLTSAEDRAAAELALGAELPRLVAELEALVSLHPHRERLRSLLVRALHADGRSAEALGAYEQFRSWLADQLGSDPSRDLQETHLAVLRAQQDAARLPRGRRRDNLRSELTSFVGREQERARLGEQLADSRLVTLVGTGGTGKTRLATAVARDLADSAAPGGVWLVELASVTDPQDVAPTVLAALGSRGVRLSDGTGGPGDVVEQLTEVLAAAATLIVLDNCEHVVEAAARLADELLGRCPQLRILATSREPLGILGEALFPVTPLGLPRPLSPAETVAACPAVRLFADRAASVRPGFGVTAENASAVSDICRRLDGLPLAIELAAARMRTLSAAQLAERLDDRFQVLTGGSRTARPEHRTLRAVVAWGWDLLHEEERSLAERLSVFPATITLDAAERVASAGAHTLDTLTSLVEKSVLQVVDGTEIRFRMLETLRAYGLERLAARGGVDSARRAHARCFLALAESAEPHLRDGLTQIGWTHVLTADRENLLAAFHFACETRDADTAVRLGAALWYFWTQRGEHTQAVRLLRTALRLPGDTDPAARALATAGYLLNSILSGDSNSARSGLAELRPYEGPARIPSAAGAHPAPTLTAPLLAWVRGDSERGLREIDGRREVPDPWTRAMLWLIRSMFSLNDGDLVQGCRDLRRCAEEFRIVGERWGLATSLTYLAIILISRSEFEDAGAALTEAMGPARELGGDDLQRVWLAVSHRHAGRVEAAREELRSVVSSPSSASHLRMARLILGDLARLDGDFPESSRQYALARGACSPDTFDDSAFGTLYWAGTGRLALARGDLAGARRSLRKALDGALEAADMMLVAIVGVAVAQLLHSYDDFPLAGRLLGAAHALRGASDAGNPDISRLVAALTEELGESGFRAAYEEGRALERDDAVAGIQSLLDRGGVAPAAGVALG